MKKLVLGMNLLFSLALFITLLVDLGMAASSTNITSSAYPIEMGSVCYLLTPVLILLPLGSLLLSGSWFVLKHIESKR